MSTVFTPLRALALILSLSTLSCHAQTKVAASLTPDLARRIEILIRSKSTVPPEYTVSVAGRRKSEIPGYDEVAVTFADSEGQSSKPMTFLVSDDNKTLAQFNRYDISHDPKTLVSAAGRPARGGPESAPVTIVGFDDLECPYCARMHAELFPALLARYKDQVRIVYRDFPIEQHPWALRAAIDANCLGVQSTPGYWNVIDYIHAHAADFGGADHSLVKANEDLDTLTKEEGVRQKIKSDTLAACIVKQDDSAIIQSRMEGEKLGVQATPALFINGERFEGALPIEYVYRVIDNALLAEGKTPPPPVPVPPMPGAAPKPGN